MHYLAKRKNNYVWLITPYRILADSIRYGESFDAIKKGQYFVKIGFYGEGKTKVKVSEVEVNNNKRTFYK